MPDKPDALFVGPAEVAETMYHLATQPRRAWSLELEVRPHVEGW